MTGAQGRERRWLVLPLLGVLVLVVLQLQWIDEPFDASAGGVVSGQFVAYSIRAFDELGLERSGWVWTQFFHPDAEQLQVGYLNHPVFSLFLLHPAYGLLGRDERALRLPVLLLTVIGVLFFLALVRRCAGTTTAAVAAVLFATAPLMVLHATILCPFGVMGTSLALATAVAWWAWRQRGGWGRYLVFAGGAIASLATDWAAGFLLPGLLAALALERGAPRRGRAGAATLAPYALGVVALALWFVREAGGTTEALAHLRVMRSRLQGFPGGFAGWLEAMGSYLSRGFGWPLLALALIGAGAVAVRVLRGAATPRERCSLALVIAGVLPSVMFYSRAASHEFWILPALPAAALLATGGLELLCRTASRAGRVVLLVTAVGVAGYGAWAGVAMHAAFRSDLGPERAAALDTVAGRGDVVVLIDLGDALPYYAEASVMTLPEANLLVFDQAVRHLALAQDALGRIVLAIPEAALSTAQGWVSTLPLVEETVRVLPYGTTSLLVGELDAERLFGR